MKKLFVLFLLAGSMGLLQAQPYSGSSSYSQGQSGQGGSQRNQDQSGTQASNLGQGSVSDQQLNSQIQSTLSSYQNQGKFNNVTATVNSGNVTLQGTVSSQDDKDTLGALVGGISGVRSVNNQVTVSGSAGASQGSYGSSGYGSSSGSPYQSYQGPSYQGSQGGSSSSSYPSSSSNY